jgi:4-hydroxy-tetrahydrodipicolinate synthase
VRHCRWLLKSGCAGLAVFGTNSEANSLSVSEKKLDSEKLVAGGVPGLGADAGTGHCALSDSIEMTRAAVELGCAGVLMLPPFYYKGVSDEGLYRNFAEVIERVGDERLQLYLYHIPPGRQVAITLRSSRSCLLEISRHRRRRKGLLGRLVQHQGDARRVREGGLRRLRRQRGVPARQHAQRRQGLHHRHRQHQSGPIANVYRNWRSAEAERSRPASARRARSCRSSR